MSQFKKILSEMSGNFDKQVAATVINQKIDDNEKNKVSCKFQLVINDIPFEIATGYTQSIKRLMEDYKSLNIDTNTKGLVKIFLKVV